MIKVLSRYRFSLENEKRLQDEIAAALLHNNIPKRKEVRLSPEDVIDFMVGDIGIEVKLKGQRREILRQCERYAEHDEVKAIVLVTNAAMGFPEQINGKPAYLLSLGRAWL